MKELPAALLKMWPGRFRFGDLIDEPPAGLSLVPGALAGIVDGYDERQALDQLIAEGRFRTARRFIDECPEWGAEAKDAAIRRIEQTTARFQQEIEVSYQAERQRAEAAGVTFDLILLDLLDGCVEDCRAVRDRLRRASKGTDEAIQERHERLDGLVKPNSLARRAVDALFRAGQLEAVDHLLSHGSLETLPPEALERLPPFPAGYDAKEVLSWHMDRTRPALDFAARWATPDDVAHEVLVRYSALQHGGEAAALGFAAALNEFLDGTDSVSVDLVDHGYLATLPRVLDLAGVPRLLSSTSLQLYVCAPDLRTPPAVPGLGPHVLVGWNLSSAEQAGRAGGAVLALEEILQLVTAPSHRTVQLLRLVAPQWPATALGVGSPAQLRRSMRRGPPWEVLVWLTDIAGLGGSVTAARLAYLSGEYDVQVLSAALEYLMGPGPHPHMETHLRRLDKWWADPELLRRIEDAVVGQLENEPDSVATFWAALDSAIPGETVQLNDLIITCELEHGFTDVEATLRAGLHSLARHRPPASDGGEEWVRLAKSGAVGGLRSVAAARLRDCFHRLEPAARSEDAASVPLTVWRSHRFALRPGLTEPAAAAEEVVTDLLAHPVDEERRTDVAEVLTDLLTVLSGAHPDIVATIEGGEGVPVAASRKELLTVLFEVLDNAVDATAGRGRVSVEVEEADLDVIISVQDSGGGIPDEIEQEFRVFRPGVSTKSASRGVGLYLARAIVARLGGELLAERRQDGHPLLRGARFRIVLPRA